MNTSTTCIWVQWEWHNTRKCSAVKRQHPKTAKEPKSKKAIDQLHKETSRQRKQKQRPISAIELRQETFDNKLIMAKKHPIPM